MQLFNDQQFTNDKGVCLRLSDIKPGMISCEAEQITPDDHTVLLSDIHTLSSFPITEPRTLMAYFKRYDGSTPKSIIHDLCMFWNVYHDELPVGFTPWCNVDLWYGHWLHFEVYNRTEGLGSNLINSLNTVRLAFPAIHAKLTKCGVWHFDLQAKEDFSECASF